MRVVRVIRVIRVIKDIRVISTTASPIKSSAVRAGILPVVLSLCYRCVIRGCKVYLVLVLVNNHQ